MHIKLVSIRLIVVEVMAVKMLYIGVILRAQEDLWEMIPLENHHTEKAEVQMMEDRVAILVILA